MKDKTKERICAGIMVGFVPAFIGFIFLGIDATLFFIPGFAFGYILPEDVKEVKDES